MLFLKMQAMGLWKTAKLLIFIGLFVGSNVWSFSKGIESGSNPTVRAGFAIFANAQNFLGGK